MIYLSINNSIIPETIVGNKYDPPKSNHNNPELEWQGRHHRMPRILEAHNLPQL